MRQDWPKQPNIKTKQKAKKKKSRCRCACSVGPSHLPADSTCSRLLYYYSIHHMNSCKQIRTTSQLTGTKQKGRDVSILENIPAEQVLDLQLASSLTSINSSVSCSTKLLLLYINKKSEQCFLATPSSSGCFFPPPIHIIPHCILPVNTGSLVSSP